MKNKLDLITHPFESSQYTTIDSEEENLAIEVEPDTEATEEHPENIVVDDGVPDVMFLTNEERYQRLTYGSKYIVKIERERKSMNNVFRSPSIC